jgi:hypothetical protein
LLPAPDFEGTDFTMTLEGFEGMEGLVKAMSLTWDLSWVF